MDTSGTSRSTGAGAKTCPHGVAINPQVNQFTPVNAPQQQSPESCLQCSLEYSFEKLAVLQPNPSSTSITLPALCLHGHKINPSVPIQGPSHYGPESWRLAESCIQCSFDVLREELALMRVEYHGAIRDLESQARASNISALDEIIRMLCEWTGKIRMRQYKWMIKWPLCNPKLPDGTTAFDLELQLSMYYNWFQVVLTHPSVMVELHRTQQASPNWRLTLPLG